MGQPSPVHGGARRPDQRLLARQLHVVHHRITHATGQRSVAKVRTRSQMTSHFILATQCYVV